MSENILQALGTKVGLEFKADRIRLGVLEGAKITGISIDANDNLVLATGDETNHVVSLASFMDEDSRAIASGVLNSATGIVTFTRDDSTTFTLDLSALLDDTNLVTSVAGKTGVVTLVKADVGLGNVDNTSDLAKPISTATQTALDARYTKAELGTVLEFNAALDAALV